MTDIATIIALGIAFGAFSIASYSAIISRKTLRHQALLDIRKDYRSAEMTAAIDGLWDFYRDCETKKQNLKDEYKKRVDQEKKLISNNKMEIEEGLNYKRRLVTHFYSHLSSIHRFGVLPSKMIFDWWIPEDLEMVEKFIIPLQEANLDRHGVSKNHIRYSMQPLKELKDACELYFKEKSDC